VAALCAACGSHPPQSGSVRAVVSTELVTAGAVTAVRVAVTPGGPTDAPLVYDGSDGTFSGTFTVSTGEKTVTASAYQGAILVGRGSATVPVAAGATAAVTILVYDDTGPPPVPDHGPVILTLVVPSTTIMAGESQTLVATAFDGDAHPIAWSWSLSPAGCGSFASPAAPSTLWTAGASPGACSVTATATANGKSDARSHTVQIVPATGDLDVQGRFVPHPFVAHVSVGSGGATLLDVARSGTDATSAVRLTPGATYEVRAYYAPAEGESVALTDSCGGPLSPPTHATGSSEEHAAFTWTAPASPSACVLSAKLTVPKLAGTFEDTFPIVVRVGL
jgi:hypothetical protein